MPPEGVLETYRADGLVQVHVPQSVCDLQLEFLRDCCTWLQRFADCDTSPSALPEVLPHLGRQLVARLYKVSRRFRAAKALAAHPWFTQLAAECMQTDLVSCCHFVNVRIDLPEEETYLLPIHQDFPFIQGSLNGVTIWLPFHDTPQQVGPPAWIPGSHRWGVQPVREERYGSGPVPSGGRSFDLADTSAFPASSFVSRDVAFGTALVFSTLLLHRSQRNNSPIARVNLQLRYDDALATESFERNYPEGLYLGDSLAKTYPEYVLSACSA